MKLKQHFNLDLARGGCKPMAVAVQGEANTRVLVVSLFDNGAEWKAPAGTTAAVAFQKPDGKKGIYDTLPNGDPAVAIVGSTVEATLAPQVLTTAGKVTVSINFYDAEGDTMATFPFIVVVEYNPAVDAEASEDYFNSVNPLITIELEKLRNIAAEANAAAASAADSAAGSHAAAETASSTAGQALAMADQTDKKVEALGEIVSKFHSSIVDTAIGEVVALSDASDMKLDGLRIFGKTTQNGTPTPDAPAPLESVGDGGSVTVNVGISETDDNPQTVTTQKPTDVPVFLPGIPVTSGGNYTDESGQQWVCDEVDFKKGVYVQRVDEYTFTGDEHMTVSGTAVRVVPDKTANYKFLSKTEMMCNRFTKRLLSVSGTSNANTYLDDGVFTHFYTAGSSTRVFFFKNSAFIDADTAKAWFKANETKILFQLAEHIEHDLSPDELAQYVALHTNHPNTTIFNDGGADMEVKYSADTKLYIDKKFDQLALAMLNQ